ncbi:hypothetical protein V500_02479 [Pseudogymnoascus sp. VKM F-4518 (FW-2643)]|nr:hypothetical protein V500_02479 [Pseudogymnoascus sp. VKM F-4518 (FW-2643)]
MADVQIAPSFGAELKDAFKPVNSWVSQGISWLDDIQQFYRERSVIEKEYAAKLNVLAKKYFEKKAKKSGALSVGDTPAMTPGSLESASLTTWTTQLTTLESRAAEHDRYGNELVLNVAEPLRNLGLRYEDIRKRQADYADKLEKERDSTYNDLKKTKAKYDAACQEVENKRKKAESAFDYSKTKAQNSYQQQLLEMNNAKNTYLIAIRATNKQKEMYYHEYVPDVLDGLQDLNESRTVKLNGLWSLAASLELGMIKRSTDIINYLAQEIPRNVPTLDTMMFVRHNAAPWQEPPNKAFEPSPVWHDDDSMIVDEPAKVFLRNMLNKSKSQLGDLRREVDMRRKEVEGLKRIQQSVREGKDKRDEVVVWSQLLIAQEQLHDSDHKRLNVEVETTTITTTIGDLTIGAKNHNFKSQTFKIPTNCDLCGERIWGLSAKGFDCRDCGYTCHSKCEMKVPAECPGEQSKDGKKKLKASRQEGAGLGRTPSVAGNGDLPPELPAPLSRSNTMNSLSSGYAASANRSVTRGGPQSPTEPQLPDRSSKPPGTLRKSRVVAPPPTAYISELPGSSANGASGGLGVRSSEPRGKMLYAYDASGEGEISVGEGDEVTITEPDDGSGWVKVKSGFREGLVPGSYLEMMPSPSPALSAARPASTDSNSGSSVAGSVSKKQGPAVAPKRGARKLRYVEALYDYTAQSEAEHNMLEGDRFVLIKEDPGDGWSEVERGGVTKSVPANYVQLV